MSVEKTLKKEGIIVTGMLDTLKVNSVATNIAKKLISAFPEHDFQLADVFMKLSRLHMYTANIPNGFSEANYFYKNTSIYFNEKIDIEDLDTYAMHECIHYLQERKDKKGHLMRLGLCDLTEFKLYGLGINEAAVQLATAKATEAESDSVKYYGITFDTISPSCYPLQSNLINQMAYITGEYVLFDSTFNSNNDFKNKFIELTSKKAFYKIQDNFDKLLFAEEDLIKLNNEIETKEVLSSEIYKINTKIYKLKNLITNTFIETQNLILTSYFDNSIKDISNLEDLENYRRKLYNYRNIIGITENYNFFNTYYINMMTKLEEKHLQLENGEVITQQTSLSIVKQNKFLKFIQTIKNTLFKTDNTYEKIKDEQ